MKKIIWYEKFYNDLKCNTDLSINTLKSFPLLSMADIFKCCNKMLV
jgi:hypothetical protein